MKKTILYIFALSTLWMGFQMVYWADPTFTDITSTNFAIDLSNIDPVNQTSGAVTGGSTAITILLNKIATFLLYLVPIIAAVSLVIAGYYYILSSWDSEKANKAKTIIKWNAIAVIVALSSYAIIAVIASLLDANI